MDKDKISIIIQFTMLSNILKGQVDSVLMQNYAQLEIILVDDASTDGLEILCDDFLECPLVHHSIFNHIF